MPSNKRIKMEDFENDKTDFDDEDDAPEKSDSVQRMFSNRNSEQADFYGSQRNISAVDESGTI